MPAFVSTPSFRIRTAIAVTGMVLTTLLMPVPAAAHNAITVDSGYGLDDTRLLRFNLAMGNDRRTPAREGWSWGQSWEANLSYWYLYKHKEGVEDLFELGLTPNFRVERDWAASWGRPYLEAGLGLHLLSKVHIGSRDLGSALQFGTHAGFGVRFGAKERWDLAWRFEHLSNGGLKEPNPGINFAMVRFGYRW